MFIETYYDERAAVPATTSEPMIPYPELSGEELASERRTPFPLLSCHPMILY